MKQVFVVVLFLVLIMVMVAPAGATPPEEIIFVVKAHFTPATFSFPSGTWESEGVIDTDGEPMGNPVHFGAGWPHGVGFLTAHSVEILGDGEGTITVSSQITGFEWSYDVPCELEPNPETICDEHYEGTGRWVILSGTGKYANVHGQGKVHVVGEADGDWPAGWTMDTMATYEGMAHFDPQ